MWREMGMWVLGLVVFLIFGRMWFHLVEELLARIRSLWNRHREPPVWHTFEETDSRKSETHDGQKQERRR